MASDSFPKTSYGAWTPGYYDGFWGERKKPQPPAKGPDPAVESVIERIKKRSEQGMAKYGRPITETPGDLRRWLLDIQEELTDAAVYIERALLELDKKA